MQALQKQLMGYSSNLLSDPTAGTGGLQLQGLNQLNQGYANMPEKVSAQLSARGFGKSGTLGGALYNTENSRLNDQSNLQGQYAQMVLNRQQQGANLGESLLNSARGNTTTGPSSMAANGLLSAGNGLSNLSTLLMLHNVLSPNGGKGGGGFTPSAQGSGSFDSGYDGSLGG